MINYEEFLMWIGLYFMMVNIQGFQCRGLGGSGTIDPFETDPYRFNDMLPWIRFEEILKEITITDYPPQ